MPRVYISQESDYQRMTTLYVRTSSHPAALMAAIRAAFQELDPALPFEASTLESHLDTALSRERLVAFTLTALGGFTLILAAVGLYGLISLAVSRRSREIGIRMALGARPGRVVANVLTRFALLCATGAVVGLVTTLALGRHARPLLFGVQPVDPASMALACGLLLLVAAASAAMPAFRAASADPLAALRQE
jgi:ABC-type antimicrobial peptide transport system permease subunit